MQNRRTKALLVAASLLCFPLCAQAGGTPAVVQNEEDLLWLKKGHDGTINSVVFSPDGQLFATASEDFPAPARTIRLWRSSDGELIRTLPLGAGGTTIDISPDGTLLATGSPSNRSILLWSITGDSLWKQIVVGETEFADIVVRFTPDGRSIAAHAIGGLLGVWNIETGRPEQIFAQAQTHPQSIDVSPDGRYIATTDLPGKILLWERGSETPVQFFLTGGTWVVRFSPHGEYLAASGREQSGEQPIILWRTADWKVAHILRGHKHQVQSIVFSPSGNYVVTIGNDKGIKIWNINQEQVIYEYQYIDPDLGFPVGFSAIGVPNDSSTVLAASGEYLMSWQAHWSVGTTVAEGHPDDIGMQITPNPASSHAVIQFDTGDVPSPVSISLWDAQGRAISTVFEGTPPAGVQSFPLTVAGYPAGTYFCRVQMNDTTYTLPLIIQNH